MPEMKSSASRANVFRQNKSLLHKRSYRKVKALTSRNPLHIAYSGYFFNVKPTVTAFRIHGSTSGAI
jgi:ATP sulfurylase